MKDDDRIQKELVKIAEAHDGLLRPQDVVAFAKNKRTALHSKFTWDDGEAAAQYRLWQARQVIRVSVVILPTEGGERSARHFVSLVRDRKTSGGGYRKLVAVMEDGDMREELLAQARDDAERFRQKYADLVELAPIIAAIDKLMPDESRHVA